MKNTLNVQEQAELFTGDDSWHTRAFPEKGVPAIRVSDGPSGLRIEEQSKLGESISRPAVAWPTESALACSFDRALLRNVGVHLGQECRKEGVNVLLGPGVNHKRSPLGGRNFEYLSEDPILSGELGAAYVNGVQSMNVGTSLKHFAVNSREKGRLIYDAVIDERTLQEIYLRQFSIIVKKSKPYTIMNAYNRLNGTYCCENEALMQEARKWGFDGAFFSDWGAVSDPVASINTGLNLEMPGGNRHTEKRIVSAVEEGTLKEETLNASTQQLLDLIEKTQAEPMEINLDEHLSLAEKAAEESAVLLKNESILPLQNKEGVALIGVYCDKPCFEGHGSSHVNTITSDSLCSALKKRNIAYTYAPGYRIDSDNTDHKLLQEAVQTAEQAETVIVAIGLNERTESEGYDRENLDLPDNQNELIHELCRINKHVVVVLQVGAPVVMPWLKEVQAVLLMHLGGCMSGEASARLLLGEASPSGKLAETWPKRLSDTPAFAYFNDQLLQMQYREAIFTGYRFYDTAGIAPQYPFGYGLSYTSFACSDLSAELKDYAVAVTLRVTNTGTCRADAAVQIYSRMKNSRIARPYKELRDFARVSLEAGETKTVVFEIPVESFAYYDVQEHEWLVEGGTYQLLAGCDSTELNQCVDVELGGMSQPYSTIPMDYLHCPEGTLEVSDEVYEKVLGHEIPKPRKFVINGDTSIAELNAVRRGRWVNRMIRRVLKNKRFAGVKGSMVYEAPLRMVMMFSEKANWDTVDGAVEFMKGSMIKGIRMIKDSVSKKNKENQ